MQRSDAALAVQSRPVGEPVTTKGFVTWSSPRRRQSPTLPRRSSRACASSSARDRVLLRRAQTLAEVCRDSGTPLRNPDGRARTRHPPGACRVTWADRPLSELADHIVEDLPRAAPAGASPAARAGRQAPGARRRAPSLLTVVEAGAAPVRGRAPRAGDGRGGRVCFPLIRPARGGRSGDEDFGPARRAPHASRTCSIRMPRGRFGLLRGITGGYEPPSNACADVPCALPRLSELER